jgi:hypothetical protein
LPNSCPHHLIINIGGMVPNALIYWVRGAPLRFFAHWLLHCSRMRTSVGADGLKHIKYPPACDLTNDQYSPITVMQQFYAKVLSSSSSCPLTWLKVLERYVNDPALWPEFKHRFRRHIAQATCEVERRHTNRFKKWNFYLARLVDGRLTNAERVQTAEDALAAFARHCCMEKDFALRIMSFAFMLSVVEMLGPIAQIVLLAIYWTQEVTTALAECEHARNHNLLHKHNSWHLFAANCTLADSRAMLGTRAQKSKGRCTITSDCISAKDRKSKACRIRYKLIPSTFPHPVIDAQLF